MRIRLLGLIAVAAFCALPGSASASSVFGIADINQDPVGTSCTGCAVVTTVHADATPDTGSPIAGVVTNVRVRTSGGATDASIGFVRPTGNPLEFFNPGPDIPISVTADATPAGHITELSTQRSIAAGDRIALLGFPAGVKVAVNGPPRDCAFSLAGNAAGTTMTYSSSSCNNNEWLVQATVEPDADHDGFGDETQDQCPTDASTQGPCPTSAPPTPPPPHKKKCKKHKHRSAEVAKKCKKKHR
jgi:hypothetical protein